MAEALRNRRASAKKSRASALQSKSYYVAWIKHGTPLPDGSEYLAHGPHSTLVKLKEKE
jgi:hypothetical protein